MRKTVLFILLVAAFLAVPACLPLGTAIVFAWEGSPLTLSYSGGTGVGRSTSIFDENIWSYDYQYHVLVLTGDVPQGSLFSQLQLEETNNIAELSYARFAISGKTYSVSLGDNTDSFSELTLSSINYQGANVTIKPTSDLSLTVVGGSRGNGLWGADVRRDTRPQENFTGVRSVYNVGSGFGVNATYITASGGNNVLSYGGDYTYNDLKLGMEYGTASGGKALRGEVKYQTNALYLGTIYRDIDSTYIVPFDYVSYKGMKGTFISAGIRPTNNLSINIQNDSYMDRLNGMPGITNVDTRGDITFNSQSGTGLGYSGWKNDRSAYDRGNITEGEMMYITQTFCLLTKNAIYYRFQPTWFTSMNSSEESYSENKNVTGVNISLFDAAHLNYEIENTARFIKSTDIAIFPYATTARLDLFESRIMESPFWVSSSINYREEKADRSSTEEATSVSCYSDITLKYIPNSDFSCFVTAKMFNMDSPDADRTAREQKDISFGLTYTFNTNFYLK